MLRKYQRGLSIITVLCLVVSLLIGTTAVSFAKDKTVESIKIIGLPEFAAGGAVADAVVTIEPEPGVTIEMAWTVWNEEADDYIDVTESTFGADEVYRAEMYVYANPGYVLSEDFYLEYTEELEYLDDVAYVSCPWEENGTTASWVILDLFTATTQIAKVEITTPEKLEAGGTPFNVEAKCYDKDGNLLEDAAVIETVWYDGYYGDGDEMTDTAFQKECNYSFEAIFHANEGFSFCEVMEVYVNGEEEGYGFSPRTLFVHHNYTLKSPLAYLDFGTLSFKAGDELFMELDPLGDVEDFDVIVDWFYANGYTPDEDVFVAGKTYYMHMRIYSMEEQELADDFAVIINGERYPAVECDGEQAKVIYKVQIPAADQEEISDGTVQTGDESNMTPWMILALTALAAAACAYRVRPQRD